MYDLETFPNVFLCGVLGCDSEHAAIYEISDRRDDREPLLAGLHQLAANRIEMVGFNNIGFDYPIIHQFLNDPTGSNVASLYAKAQAIITTGDRFAHTVWPSDRYIPQLDLFKIHHFDNVARATSLKALQFNMRSASVEDLPIPPGTMLTPDQIDALRNYLINDLTSTRAFYNHSREQIDFRRVLSERYGRDFLNHNDTKIGKDYFVMRLEEARPGSCYQRGPNGREPVQTYRSEMRLADVILPYIRFQHPELQRVHSWLHAQVIAETKGVFTDLN